MTLALHLKHLVAVALLLLSTTTTATTASNDTKSTVSVAKTIAEASDSFSDFIIDVSNDFIIAVGSSDRPFPDWNLTQLFEDLESVDKKDTALQHFVDAYWKDALLVKIGVFVCVVVGLLFVVVMPFVGFCFCCCRCCGNCGGGKRSGKKRHGKRLCCQFVLLLFGVVAILFVVGAFVLTAQLNRNAKKIVDPEADLITAASLEMSVGLREVFDSLVDVVNSTVDGVVDGVVVEIDVAASRAKTGVDAASKELSGVLDDADVLLKRILSAKADLLAISSSASQLKSGEFGSDLSALLLLLDGADCQDAALSAGCNALKTELAGIDGLVDIPGVEASLKAVEDLERRNLTKDVEEAKTELDGAGEKMFAEVMQRKSVFTNVTDEARSSAIKSLDSVWDEVRPSMDNFEKSVKEVKKTFKENEVEVNDSIDYTTYGFYVVAAMAGLVVLFLVIAFFLSCCSGKTSADCFMASVGFYFIFCPLLMLFTVLFYNSLGQMHYEMCEPLLNPTEGGSMLADEVIKIYLPAQRKFSVHDVILRCSKGEPIYRIVESTHLVDKELEKLEKKLDPNSFLPNMNSSIADAEEQIIAAINSTVDADGISKRAADALQADDLANATDYAFNATKVKASLAAFNLTQFSAQLKDMSTKASTSSKPDLSAKLDAFAANFSRMEADGVVGRDVEPKLDAILAHLKELGLKAELAPTAQRLVANLTSATSSFVVSVSTVALDAVAGFQAALLNRVRGALNDFWRRLRDEAAPCTPIWSRVEDAVSIPCRLLLDPINGFWFEIGGFVVVGVVVVIFSVKVAGLLRDEVQNEKWEDDYLASPTHNGKVSPVHNGVKPHYVEMDNYPDRDLRSHRSPQHHYDVDRTESYRLNNAPRNRDPRMKDGGHDNRGYRY